MHKDLGYMWLENKTNLMKGLVPRGNLNKEVTDVVGINRQPL
ncbi:MAG: hypothetical protein QGG23_05495 [Candidatus Bathyarchaeota archaeon]|nr:hypothetical protein [Candidatus Bathyarchaeota archaeon]